MPVRNASSPPPIPARTTIGKTQGLVIRPFSLVSLDRLIKHC
jgi:hypothetical protein